MNLKTHGKSTIFVLLSATLLTGVLSATLTTGALLDSSVFAQPAATGNATEPFDLTIYSKATGTDYVYNNLKSKQDIINAINDVQTLTHPELASVEPSAAEALFADNATDSIASSIFDVSTVDADEASAAAVPVGAIIAGGQFVYEHKDTIIKYGKKLWDAIF